MTVDHFRHSLSSICSAHIFLPWAFYRRPIKLSLQHLQNFQDAQQWQSLTGTFRCPLPKSCGVPRIPLEVWTEPQELLLSTWSQPTSVSHSRFFSLHSLVIGFLLLSNRLVMPQLLSSLFSYKSHFRAATILEKTMYWKFRFLILPFSLLSESYSVASCYSGTIIFIIITIIIIIPFIIGRINSFPYITG